MIRIFVNNYNWQFFHFSFATLTLLHLKYRDGSVFSTLCHLLHRCRCDSKNGDKLYYFLSDRTKESPCGRHHVCRPLFGGRGCFVAWFRSNVSLNASSNLCSLLIFLILARIYSHYSNVIIIYNMIQTMCKFNKQNKFEVKAHNFDPLISLVYKNLRIKLWLYFTNIVY